MHTMHGTEGCTISVDHCVMDLQQVSLRDNALLRRHAECNFPPRSIYSLSSHMSATCHMFICSSHSTELICYDIPGTWGTLTPLALMEIYCQNPSLARNCVLLSCLVGSEQPKKKKDSEWFCCMNLALICIFNSVCPGQSTHRHNDLI